MNNVAGGNRISSRNVFVAAMLLVTATGVHAGVPLLLSTDPAQPRASQDFEVVYAAFCEDIFPAYAPSNRIVEIEDYVVTITVRRIGQFCMGQPYIPSYGWDVGPLPEGTYQLELRGYNVDPQISFPIASGEVIIEPTFV